MRGIYIHVPFCIKKCNYCDFCSFPEMLSRQEEYTHTALGEMESYREENIKADTLYFGGGTPSLLSLENISEEPCSHRRARGAAEPADHHWQHGGYHDDRLAG